MSNLKRSYKTEFISLIVITLIFFFDRISKIKIINAQLQNNTVYINDFINLDLVWNTGIGFGILSTNTALFYNFITFLIFSVIIFLLYLILKSKFIDKILYSIVVGGALGNFYDRLVYFAVPDFIDFHFQSFHWFTFNIADIFITIGIITIIGKELIIKDEKN
ncbi:MAG: signal peptidase II [Candidatus Pelagibacter sp. TMED128]|nr:MAG: signal peptidase II [Candidatus Pelagibacter sp. TMED128]|tara:strand:- start:297 stop:785 length:489 start_codon:yes stop_codon:yes gene_type:complete